MLACLHKLLENFVVQMNQKWAADFLVSVQNFHLFKGARCESDIDECASFPCKNGATCVDQPGNYFCQCVAPFKGNEHRGRGESKHNYL